MDVKATGTKVLIKRGSSEGIMEDEGYITFEEQMNLSGILGKVVDTGSKTDIDVEEGEIVVFKDHSGIQFYSAESADSLRLIEQSSVYGVLGFDESLFIDSFD
jgi:co-chaperonin GroES (HSP10)